MLLSVIIPVYNASKFIRKCISSILISNRKDFELIIINDGSSDDSGIICKEFITDERVRYYEQENSGVAVARNNGLNRANGEYICFVDADDFVSESYIDTICQDISINMDLVIYNHYSGIPGRFNLINVNLPVGVSYDLITLYSAVFEYRLNAQWDKIFRSDIIKKYNILFPINIKAGEDSIFFLHYLRYVKRYFVSNNSLYYYVKNDSSAMANPKIEYISNLNKVFVEYTIFKDEMNVSDYCYKILCNELLKSLIKKIVSFKKKGVANYIISNELCKTGIYKSVISYKYPGIKDKIKCFLLKWKMYDIIWIFMSDK